MGCIDILLAFIYITERFDDRQKVIGLRSIVLIHNLLHTLLPFDEELLPRLASAIGKHTILQILFSQVCHIHEWHTSGIEAHKEHISGEVKGRIHREVHLLNSLDDFQRYGSLDGLIHSRIDVLEREALWGKFLLYGTIIYCSEITHIEWWRVWTHSVILQICFVCHHHIWIHIIQRHILVLSEASETA